jgi:hypothetical protein
LRGERVNNTFLREEGPWNLLFDSYLFDILPLFLLVAALDKKFDKNRDLIVAHSLSFDVDSTASLPIYFNGNPI